LGARLVVYGTLRRGEPRSHFLEDAQFLGPVELQSLDLLDLGPFPGAVPGTGPLRAELYELHDPRYLDLLDLMEGVHEDPPLYRRVPVEVGGAPAWIYLFARDAPDARRIPGGDWTTRG